MKQQTCIAIKGFNTKQWWAYNEEKDVFIDPPIEVLSDIDNYPEEEQEDYFNSLLAEEPDWLNDEAYYYEDIER